MALLTFNMLLVLLLGASGTRLASELDANLPLQDLLSTELSNGTIGFLLRGQVDEGITNGTSSTGMSGDGRGFAEKLVSTLNER